MAAAQNSANRIVGDAVFGIRTVASFNLEHQFYEGFCASSGELARLNTVPPIHALPSVHPEQLLLLALAQ